MSRNFFTICILFLSFQIVSQDAETMKSVARFSSDAELTTYINKAKSNSLSLIDVEKLVSAQGASATELQKLRTLWNAGTVNSSSSVDILPDSPGSSLGSSGNTKITPKASRRFGSNFFENKNISEVPQLFIATPSDYRLGPGDELIINLYGASENSYSVQISRNGTVKFDRIAPIYLSGLSIASAKTRLKNRLSKLYAGLVSSDELSKVDIDVSLQKARSVVINITGQVTAPGTYTISGFSSVLNALFAAGGPNGIGSFRNIKLIRNGKVNKTIDLYDYFVNGIYPSVYMRDQDVILVEAYNKQVNVISGFKTNGLFELKEDENLNDVLNFSGGLSSNSYKEKLFINRINSYSRSIVEISKEKFSNSNLVDGDIINAKTISTLIENSISISGSVYLPGIFDLSAISTVNDLIEAANGLNPSAINKGFLYRSEKGIEDEIIDLNLLDRQDLNINLKDQDRIVILSREDLIDLSSVKTAGYFNSPGTFTLKEGMTITNAIILSGGFKNVANRNLVILSRNQTSDNGTDFIENMEFSFDENYKTDNDILLEKNDIVTVRMIPFLRDSESFLISGEVSSPGEYPIYKQNFNIKHAFENIKFTNDANNSQLFVERDGIKIPVSSKNSFLIKNGDNVVVPKYDNTISVSGAVQQNTILDFEFNNSFKKSIVNSGGFSENADKKRAYVIYPNGLKKQTHSFLFFRNYPKIIPGSSIIVPPKPEKNRTNVAEIVGYSTSLVSIIALIKSF
ncbi:SLBB domain-containing protein [Flavobacteriaceae bacterium]|nr:SLBB domain-containing protein [Flavobacteriaceae bacterium]